MSKRQPRAPLTAIAVGISALVLIATAGISANDPGPAVPKAPASLPVPAVGNGRAFGEDGLADLVDDAWAQQTSAATEVPYRALLAYAGAEIAFRDDLPGCRIDWSTLAGIGYVESRHGTLHGGLIDETGGQTPDIYGIPLDGTTSASVPDTDGGELDGDPVWDRAVGPLQFIPSTWAFIGADGNRDGVADPQNIDDAALAAARYLCRSGDDLGSSDSWVAAIHRYNRSTAYINEVSGATDRYRRAAR